MGAPSYTIPTDFVRLDSRVSAVNARLNVRDLQVLKANHNALLAKRIRRCLVTKVCGDTSIEPAYLGGVDAGAVPAYAVTVPVNPWARELVISALVSTSVIPPAGPACTLDFYPFADAAGTPMTVREDLKQTHNSDTPARLDFTVDVKPDGNNQRRLMRVGLVVDDTADDYVSASAHTILAVGKYSLLVAENVTAHVGKILSLDGWGRTPFNAIAGVEADGSNYRIFVRDAIPAAIIAGTDTYTILASNHHKLYSFSVYEAIPTTFSVASSGYF